MSDRIPTKHDMDIVDALDLMYQHYMDQTDTDDQAAADFERNEAITIKRAMNEISSLRARLERVEEAEEFANRLADNLRQYVNACREQDIKLGPITGDAQETLAVFDTWRELDSEGGGDE